MFIKYNFFYRILFGSSHLYIFSHPVEFKKLHEAGSPVPKVSYETAQDEIAKYSGMNVAKSQQNETGKISYIKNGEFKNFKDSEDLVGLIKKDLY